MALRDTGCDTIEMMDVDGHDTDCGDRAELMGLFVAQASGSPSLTPIEDQVIAFARSDTLASLEAPGVLERAVRVLFGLRATGRALADARLEALRRAVVVARHRRHLPDAIARELRERGFADAQVRAIEARALAV